MLAIGDTGRALTALEEAERTGGPMWIAPIPPCDPAWDLVRHTRRFAALVRKARLDETVLRGCSR
jgi:hypothetical protein